MTPLKKECREGKVEACAEWFRAGGRVVSWPLHGGVGKNASESGSSCCEYHGSSLAVVVALQERESYCATRNVTLDKRSGSDAKCRHNSFITDSPRRYWHSAVSELPAASSQRSRIAISPLRQTASTQCRHRCLRDRRGREICVVATNCVVFE
jgi:hypothetical protein